MTKYETIDPILSAWAVNNGVRWFTEYQNQEVRTFYLNESRRDRIQVAVDVPEDGHTVVRIGQNQRGLPRLNRVENVVTSIGSLSDCLDSALEIASEWSSQQ